MAKERGKWLLHPALVLPMAFLLLVVVALLWYPPFWQPSYAPASPQPLFTQPQRGISINYAGQEQLLLLPGIGPQKAGAILAYREANGPFETPEDLLLVPGIGPATVEGMKELLLFLPAA